MMIFKSYWRKLVDRLIRQTPGIGCPEEAAKAVRRSEATITDAMRVHSTVAGQADYLATVKRRNHFRDNVADVLTARRAAR